jgi:glycosyltransferase involved in cell wall biosynthesis
VSRVFSAFWSRLRGAALETKVLIRRARWSATLRPRASTVEQIKARKAARQASGASYIEHPRVSVIVQSFNQVRNIPVLEQRLRATCAEELIVCEDGSLDGSHEEWMRRLVGPNDFLLHSNDIHEIRSYGRAIAYSRGEIVCLMQDDDQPPKDGSWLADALALFDAYPALAVLGGWCGFDEWFAVEYNAPWLPPGTGAIPFADAQTGRPLVFVENVNIGPYFVRRRVFDELGGFDLRFSAPGEPGITFEAEFCYRAWERGFQVALTDIPVKLETGTQGYIFPGGTTLWDNHARERNERANKELIEQLYGQSLPAIRCAVSEANSQLKAA